MTAEQGGWSNGRYGTNAGLVACRAERADLRDQILPFGKDAKCKRLTAQACILPIWLSRGHLGGAVVKNLGCMCIDRLANCLV